MNLDKARQIVHDWVVENGENVPSGFGLADIYIVWWSKALQNSKALVSTTLPDDMYYELTYNGDKGEIYLDVYKRQQNVVIASPVATAPSLLTTKGPHARTCKIKPHAHGSACHGSCPTCHGLARY